MNTAPRSLIRHRLTLVGLLALSCTATAITPAASAICGDRAVVNLDIGHSAASPGATSARGKPEFAFNQRFTFELKSHLEKTGRFAVRIINAGGANMPVSRRGALVGELESGVFLSIHHDSVQPRYLSKCQYEGHTRRHSDRFRGFSLFISRQSASAEASIALARAIGGALRRAGLRASLHHGEAIKGENRPLIDAANGVFRFDGLAVLKSARIPAVLVEAGVIVNRQEEADLETPAYRAGLIAAIGKALADFCLNPR